MARQQVLEARYIAHTCICAARPPQGGALLRFANSIVMRHAHLGDPDQLALSELTCFLLARNPA